MPAILRSSFLHDAFLLFIPALPWISTMRLLYMILIALFPAIRFTSWRFITLRQRHDTRGLILCRRGLMPKWIRMASSLLSALIACDDERILQEHRHIWAFEEYLPRRHYPAAIKAALVIIMIKSIFNFKFIRVQWVMEMYAFPIAKIFSIFLIQMMV